VIKKKFINPGAYSIFINQMLKDEIPIMEINEIFDFQGNYAKFIIEDGRQPRYKQVVKSDIGLRNYFHTHENYYRHIHKQISVYEPVEIVEWVDGHEDLDYFAYELGYTTSSFNRTVVEALREETIAFLKLYELTTIIDLWEDSELGDFNLYTRKWYSGLIKREEENGS